MLDEQTAAAAAVRRRAQRLTLLLCRKRRRQRVRAVDIERRIVGMNDLQLQPDKKQFQSNQKILHCVPPYAIAEGCAIPSKPQKPVSVGVGAR